MLSVHLQYRFSTDSKDSLPYNLRGEKDLQVMMKLLRPLVAPRMTKSGRISGVKKKEVTVQIFDKNDVPLTQPGGKVVKVLYASKKGPNNL